MQTELFPIPLSHSKNSFQETCEQAIRLLVFAGEQAPVELFLRGLKQRDASIRIASISALLRLQARFTRSSLRPLLQDENSDVQGTAAWVLACWGETVPHTLLDSLPPMELRRGIAEAFPPNWSQLFPLSSALKCVAFYHSALWRPGRAAGDESKDLALFRQIAEGIDPQPLLKLLRYECDDEVELGAWKIFKVMNSPLPLDILPMLLTRRDAIACETALLLGERHCVSAGDLLVEMWTLTDGKIHAAITVALNDLGMTDGIAMLCIKLQEKDHEATAALWGLGILGQRGRSIPLEMLHQMVHHSSLMVRAEAILALSSLNDIDLAEALMALNDESAELVAASFRAFLALTHTQRAILVDVPTRQLIDKYRQYHCYSYYDYQIATNGIPLFDKLHTDIPLQILLDAMNIWRWNIEAPILRYWQRHKPDIFAEMMVQAEAFLQQHL